MLELNKNQKRLPIGGHHFKDHGVMFRDDAFVGLVKKITSFRATNNIPAGNPEQEVLAFYVKNWPYMVAQSKDNKEQVIDDEYVGWRDSIYKIWSKPPLKFIVATEAQDRWKLCETCPYVRKNEWKATEESAELLRKSFLLSRGLQTPSFLGHCALHRTDLRALIYAESPASLTSKKDGELPEKCWMI